MPMAKTRVIVILILMLMAALFAVGVGAGFFNDDGGAAPKDEGGVRSALKEVPDFVKGLGGLLDGLGPKLQAEDLTDVKGLPLTVQAGAVVVIHLRASEDAD